MSARIFLVGIGPGQAEHITLCAQDVIEHAHVIIGHPGSLSRIAHLTHDKKIHAIEQNPLARSRLAVEEAQKGQDVVIVSDGDPSIYAIAATFLDYSCQQKLDIETVIVPGVGLASYASARLGAALCGDSASISLSDQNTPWSVTRRRLSAAIAADFIIVIYNPFGKLGSARWQKALVMLAKKRSGTTPVGILSQANTHDEKLLLITLEELSKAILPTDTLIIIGNSHSYVYGNYMVSPRYYKENIGY